MTALTPTPSEMMTVAAARALTSADVCFVGIGAPSAACNLARLSGWIPKEYLGADVFP